MLNPVDMLKDHKGVLMPLLAVVVIIIGMGYFYGEGGDYLSNSRVGEELSDVTTGIQREYSHEPDMNLDAGADYSATIETSKGTIEVDLFETRAPETVNNFVFLSNARFYNGLVFHRVVPGFVIQGGDPNGDGTGGPGYNFADEINAVSLGLDQIKIEDSPFLSQLYSTWNASTVGYAPNSLREHANDSLADFYDDVIGYNYNSSLQSYPFEPGVMAMANSGPNTNGSQFFITVSNSDTSSLNGRHTVFGKVISGMDVVDAVSVVETDSNSRPVDPIEMVSVVIHEN